MDLTEFAGSLLEPVAAHRTLGIEVVWAGDASGQVSMVIPPAMTNVIGSLHSGGLIALVDAAGLAAIVGGCSHTDDFDRVVPLGTKASLQFHKPGRGRLVGSCSLDRESVRALRLLLDRSQDRTQLDTLAEITDVDGDLVCQGTFTWKLRRLPAG